MNKIYKDINEFFKENFPISYYTMKNQDKTTLQQYIDASTEKFNKSINDILLKDHSESHNNKSVNL